MYIPDFKDASEKLHIALMAYRLGEYGHAADILRSLSMFIISARARTLSDKETYRRLREEIGREVAHFSECPDEALWEEMSQLYSDLFSRDS